MSLNICTWPEGCTHLCEGNTDFCATHNRQLRKAHTDSLKVKKIYQLPKPTKPIPKVSGKMAAAVTEYNKIRVKWIVGKMCVVYPDQKATTTHHMKGRRGYADKWALENGIPLLIDTRFWQPVSMDGHDWIERNPDEAKAKGWSLNRLEILK